MLLFTIVLSLIICHIQMSMAKQCGENEIDLPCAPALSCQPTCDEPDGTPCPRRICDLNACVCDEGFVRDNRNGSQCIPQSECDQVEPKKKVPVCGDNEELVKCGDPCQPSCEDPEPHPCSTFQCTPGCVCKSDYLRQTTNPTSPCLAQCPIILY